MPGTPALDTIFSQEYDIGHFEYSGLGDILDELKQYIIDTYGKSNI
ncbi:hypothetical protein FACS1894166_09550 [Bacilli bacterium]|nr:hypothetical protein FACS1894166_09550 [Bacilli bacterium]